MTFYFLQDNARISSELDEARNVQCQEKTRELRTFLLRAEEDKKRLAQRIEKLTGNGKCSYSAYLMHSCIFPMVSVLISFSECHGISNMLIWQNN